MKKILKVSDPLNSVVSNSSLRIDLGDGIKISPSDSVDSLDSRLTWKNHIDKVAKNFNSILYRRVGRKRCHLGAARKKVRSRFGA